MSIVIIQTKDGEKEITINRLSPEWICKMAKNENFIFGYLSDGTFAVIKI